MLFIHAGKYTKYMINEDMYTKIERVLSDGFSTRNYGERSVGNSVSVRIEKSVRDISKVVSRLGVLRSIRYIKIFLLILTVEVLCCK